MIRDSPEQLVIDFGVEISSFCFGGSPQPRCKLFLHQVVLPDSLARSATLLFVVRHARAPIGVFTQPSGKSQSSTMSPTSSGGWDEQALFYSGAGRSVTPPRARRARSGRDCAYD